MSNKRKIFTVVLCAVSLQLIISHSVKIWKNASDFPGLLLLVSIPDEVRSKNPFSTEFLWPSQNTALWIAKNMDYPFEHCSRLSKALKNCERPRIEYAGLTIGHSGKETDQKIFELIKSLIERGEPIDAYTADGKTALQSAILDNKPELAEMLLKAGADPHLPLKRSGALQGKNALEIIDILSSTDETGYSALRKLLQNPQRSN